MQTTLKVVGVYADGRPDYKAEQVMEADTITEKMLTVAKGQLFTLYAGLGGIIIDNPDGTTSLHPLAAFKSITIEASHIVRPSIIQ